MRGDADDLEDLQAACYREIAGQNDGSRENASDRILVAHRLLPSETVALPRLQSEGHHSGVRGNRLARSSSRPRLGDSDGCPDFARARHDP